MSAALIRCAPDLLAALEGRLRGVSCALDGAVSADFSASGPVADAYASVMDKWRKNRSDINDGIGKVADTVKQIREGFEQTDRELSAALGAPAGTAAAAGAAR